MSAGASSVHGSGTDRWIRLPDGRRLGFADYGDPEGPPALLFHGLPGSRLALAGAAQPDAEGRRLRAIAPDRPGIGLSDPHPRRRILDWPSDVAALADALGIGRFAVFGGSAGGVYALACGYALPERVTRVVLLSAPAPMERRGVWRGHPLEARLAWRAMAAVPGWPRLVAGVQRQAARHGRTLVRLFAWRMAAEDRALLGKAALGEPLRAQLAEAYRQGSSGVADDIRLVARPWGFRPEDVTVPVHLFHGLRDRTVPPAMGRALAAALPDCRAHFLPDQGHLAPAALGAVRAALLGG